MKKISLFSLFLFVVSVILSCCAGNNSEKLREDSIRKADSIAAIQAEKEEAMRAAEQARLDSIRQDSIENEEKLRIKPQYFISYVSDTQKKLKSLGFKKVREKIEMDDEIGIEVGEIRYERVLNGRKIIYEFSWDTCHAEILTFQDSSDLERFKEDLKNLGFKKEGNFYVSKKLNSYDEISIEGKKVYFGGCG